MHLLNSCSCQKNVNQARVLNIQIYNHFHNILRLFDVLPNFPFTPCETKRNYQKQTWYIRVASRVTKRLKTQDLRKLGKVKKISKLYGIQPQYPVFLPKLKFCRYSTEKQKLKLPRISLFHVKARVCLKYFVNDCRIKDRKIM